MCWKAASAGRARRFASTPSSSMPLPTRIYGLSGSTAIWVICSRCKTRSRARGIRIGRLEVCPRLLLHHFRIYSGRLCDGLRSLLGRYLPLRRCRARGRAAGGPPSRGRLSAARPQRDSIFTSPPARGLSLVPGVLAAAESQVRTGLGAGAKGIRTVGPPGRNSSSRDCSV
jgi:hypothetical protein